MLREKYQRYMKNVSPSPSLLAETKNKMRQAQEKRTFRPIWQIGTAAACALFLIAAVVAVPALGNGPSPVPPVGSGLTGDLPEGSDSTPGGDTSVSSTMDTSVPSVQGTDSTISLPPSEGPISSDRLISPDGKKLCSLNKVQSIGNANIPRHGPDTHDYVMWGKEELFAYLGKTIQPLVPEGLQSLTDTPQWQVIYHKDGKMFYDACSFGYADKVGADGYPTADARSFSVMVSKVGWYYGILYADEEPSVTNVSGTDVTFGQVTYGEEANHQVYSAFFTKDGITYSLQSRHLPLADFYRAVEALVK